MTGIKTVDGRPEEPFVLDEGTDDEATTVYRRADYRGVAGRGSIILPLAAEA